MCGEAFKVLFTALSYKAIKAEATTDKFEVAENEILIGMSASIKRQLFLGWFTYNPPKQSYFMKDGNDSTVPFDVLTDGTKVETIESMFNRWLREGEDWQCIYDTIDRCKHCLKIDLHSLPIEENYRGDWEDILYEYENGYSKF